MKKILIVSPHPDDEVLGCAGAILYHKQITSMEFNFSGKKIVTGGNETFIKIWKVK